MIVKTELTVTIPVVGVVIDATPLGRRAESIPQARALK
jgi:hypothetical protein